MEQDSQPNRKFLDKLLKGGIEIGEKESIRFIKAILEYIDSKELLFRLVKEQDIKKIIKDILSAGDSVKFTNDVVIPFMKWLEQERFQVGTAKKPVEQMLEVIYSTVGLLDSLAEKIENGQIQEIVYVGWFLVKLCSSSSGIASEARKNENVSQIANYMKNQSGLVKEYGKELYNLLSGTSKNNANRSDNNNMAIDNVARIVPGGRHGNDFEDFREIQIAPTIEEVLCSTPSFLPSPSDIQKEGAFLSDKPDSALLDRQFRLLREDMISQVRDQLELLKKPKSRFIQFSDIQIEDVQPPSSQPSALSSVVISFTLPNWHRIYKMYYKERLEYWKVTKLLQRGSLVVFMRENKVLRFGEVVWRDTVALACEPPRIQTKGGPNDQEPRKLKYDEENVIMRPRVGISFSEKDTELVLREVVEGKMPNTIMFQASVGFFAYEPVLKCLQTMSKVILQDVIVNWNPKSSAVIPLADDLSELGETFSPSLEEEKENQPLKLNLPAKENKPNETIILDISQRKALVQALRNSVSLLQGPPGTGKTFIGVILARIIHSQTTNKVLCVCYTNHSLDQFLESIINSGIEQVVRIGGRSKNSAIENYTLRNVAMKLDIQRSDGRRFGSIKTSLSLLEEKIRKLVANINDVNSNKWIFLERHLQEEEPDVYAQIQPDSSFGKVANRRGKKSTTRDYYNKWLKGHKAPISDNNRTGKSIWDYSIEERKSLNSKWEESIKKEITEDLAKKMKAYDDLQKDLEELKQDREREALSRARIIGCTTTGAAKFKKLLQDAKCSVVLVEEAAEILEAHVLTSLCENTKRLIMIGDHKQLRPKVESYQLSVDSGKGFDLNRSLFERLILANYPHISLHVQHRMRPEISVLVRNLMYPELKDGKGVLSYPPLKGIASNVVFFHHTHPEASDADLMQQGEGSLSKINKFERDVAVKTVHYLMQQGYEDNQIVVLTPYLGQLQEIKSELKKRKFSVVISKLDQKDLAKADPDEVKSESASGVRVATIDNYQGEESDVVIISLVRSNSDCDIGFVRSPERTNVLLSRAKHGMIIIGNATTLRGAKKSPWAQVIGLLETSKQVFTGIPCVCSRHNTRSDVPDAASFEKLVPNGGCLLPCNELLPCGHNCQKKCHFFTKHTSEDCRIQIEKTCERGHKYEQQCYSKILVRCKRCIQLEEEEKQEKKRLEEEKKQREAEQAETEKKMREAQAKYDQLQKELKDFEEKQKQEAEIRKKVLETEKLRQELEIKQKYAEEEQEKRLEELRKQMEAEVERQQKEAEEKYKSTKKQIEQNIEKVVNQETQQTDSNSNSNSKSEISTNTKNQNLSTAEFLAKLSIAIKTADITTIKDLLKSIPNDPKLFISQLNSTVGSAALSWFDLKPNSKAKQHPISKELKTLASNKWINSYKYFKAQENQSSVATYGRICCTIRLEPKRRDKATELLKELEQFESQGPLIPTSAYGLKFYTKCCLYFTLNDRVKVCAYSIAFLCCNLENYPPQWISWAEGLIKSYGSELASALSGKKIDTNSQDQSSSKKPSAKETWEDKKKSQKATSTIIDQLMELTGLEDIKFKFIEIYDNVTLDKSRGIDFKKKRWNVRLEGNPGTGKTTVAKLYGKLLQELGVLAASTTQETSGAKLVDIRVEGLKKLLEQIEKGGGGILFIDEAYQLDPKNDRDGKQILNYLLEVMESKIGILVVAIAGYQKDMEKLLEFNPGLTSRFPHLFKFADYTDEELLSIFKGLMKPQPNGNVFKFQNDDPKYARIAVRRLGRMRGKAGFGNAREVQNIYDSILRRQSNRLLSERNQGKDPDLFLLVREDILGPPPSQVEGNSVAWKELQNMIGLEKVKQSIRNLFELVKTNAILEEEEKPLREVALNRLFLGNPGTGKTTVATIYARILGELGLLSKGEVILKTASDFIGSVLGASEENTKKILENSIGSVLVIDEAYGLYSDSGTGNSSDPYKTAVINTIVEQVQNVPGEDRCVIMLGYKDDMQRMIRNSNPGLSRRFQLEDAFEFEDYDDDQLLEILDVKMKKRGLTASLDAKLVGVDVLAKQRKLANFGNGGAVENLLSRAVLKMQKRSNKSSELIREDFAELVEELSDQTLFGDLVGCQNIIEVLKEYRDTIQAAKSKGKDAISEGLLELNFRFVGSPGTGKTTVAYRMGKMFHSLGVLAYPDVVAKSASDLSTGYVGQTGKATRQIMEQALGRVLFIDEAYRLNPRIGGTFMQEALDELVQLLTEPKFKGKLVVILAGYEADMEELMKVNAGLRSRFSKLLKFKDLGVEDACMLLRKELQKHELELSKEGDQLLPKYMKQLVERPGFSNGRDINTWSNRIFRYWSSKRTDEITPEILENSLKLLLEDTNNESKPIPQLPSLPMASSNADSNNFNTSTASKKAFKEKEKEREDKVVEVDEGLTEKEMEAMNLVAEELGMMGNDKEPEKLLKELINADINSPSMKSYVLKVAEKLGNPNIKEVEEKVVKMQNETQVKLKKIEEAKVISLKRKVREVWKCAACGRFVPQCTFMPYRAYTENVD